MRKFAPGDGLRMIVDRFAASAWMAGLALCCALLAAEILKPDRVVTRAAMLELEHVVPTRIRQWRVDAAPPPVQPASEDRASRRSPGEQQILARTYVDDRGRRVMLVISYGLDPTNDGLQGHRPEYCYQAQGFSVQTLRDERLVLGGSQLPVRRLVAERGLRQEPITYWMMVGERAVRPGWERKFEQLRAGLGGRVPEGMLVRVSSLERDARVGHAVQAQFIESLLASLDAHARARVAGVAI